MRELQIFECEQGSPEWFQARLGVVTASEFATVMAKGRGGGDSKTRRTYMLKLAGEILTGEPMWSYTNEHMERGKAQEGEARVLYAMLNDADPVLVGFLRRGDTGASPDALVGDAGLLEIKTKLAHLHLEALLAGKLPEEHRPQVQGQLWVSGREWCDFVSYCPGLPPLVVREFRDEAYIATLASAVDAFLEELHATVKQVNSRAA